MVPPANWFLKWPLMFDGIEIEDDFAVGNPMPESILNRGLCNQVCPSLGLYNGDF